MSKRRQARHQLEDMSDRELFEVHYFGDLVTEAGGRLYVANPEKQRLAGEILQRRKRNAGI